MDPFIEYYNFLELEDITKVVDVLGKNKSIGYWLDRNKEGQLPFYIKMPYRDIVLEDERGKVHEICLNRGELVKCKMPKEGAYFFPKNWLIHPPRAAHDAMSADTRLSIISTVGCTIELERDGYIGKKFTYAGSIMPPEGVKINAQMGLDNIQVKASDLKNLLDFVAKSDEDYSAPQPSQQMEIQLVFDIPAISATKAMGESKQSDLAIGIMQAINEVRLAGKLQGFKPHHLHLGNDEMKDAELSLDYFKALLGSQREGEKRFQDRFHTACRAIKKGCEELQLELKQQAQVKGMGDLLRSVT